jgi:hypothetical protein
MGTPDGNSAPGPDWYPDPGDVRFLRYWDGAQWTEHTAPNAGGAAAAPRVMSERAKTAWQIVGGLGAALGIIYVIVVLAVIPYALNSGGSDGSADSRQSVVSAESADSGARNDAIALGHDLQDYYRYHEGALPTIQVGGGQYMLIADDGWYQVESQSRGAGLGGVKGTDGSDWCVWTRAPEGETKIWQFSAQGGLAAGSC